jgi:hypothetical protein
MAVRHGQDRRADRRSFDGLFVVYAIVYAIAALTNR